ncbi:MAG: 16S rRNA (cytosine(1402)-N(4))-methyltransferase RsmH [Acidobacteriota bacterium]
MQQQKADFSHASVLRAEVLGLISRSDNKLVVDATLGLGGHTEAILDCDANVTVIGIDQDESAIAAARERLFRFGKRFISVHGNFSSIKQIIENSPHCRPDAIIADLGVSSLQFDDASRGFSFRFDAPLDMRMDPTSGGPTAADLLETMSETELANVIYEFGEERASRRIAKWIGERNDRGEPIRTTRELAELVERAVKKGPKDKIHPATRTFQALRIAVNGELDILERFLSDSVECLNVQGVLAVISFHSLEDRIVKRTFQRLAGKCECPPRIPQCVCGAAKVVEILTRKPILPGEDELRENPRSRSAKLRACKKLGHV